MGFTWCACRDLCGGWAIQTLAQMLFLLRRYRITPKRDILSKGLYGLVRWPSFLLASVRLPCRPDA